MTDPAAETAYAKLNLALHVRARQADGYHRIETIFAFCADGDTLVVAPHGPPLTIDGPFGGGLSAGPDNLVRRAADGMAAAFGVAPPPLVLTKRLPVAAGIGGGSADAAAAIRLIARRGGIDPGDGRVTALAAALGADVPACLRSATARGDGRGELLRPAATPFGGAPVLLVNPGLPLATGPVFAGWDGSDRGPLGDDPAAWRNDLEAPAIALAPATTGLLGLLRGQPGVRLARMSGSGATCFALFATAAARDAAVQVVERPGWWHLVTNLR